MTTNEEQTIYIEDVFFLHEEGGFLYGYFDNKAYEFSRADLGVSSTASVEFPFRYPGNVTFKAFRCGSYCIGVVESFVFRFYQWGINIIYELPFTPPPFSYLLVDHKLAFCGHVLDLETLQLEKRPVFSPDTLVFQYNELTFQVQQTRLKICRGLVEIGGVRLPCAPTAVVSNNCSIVVLTDGSSTLILNLTRFPPQIAHSRLCSKLHYAYFFERDGQIFFASPGIERKWASGLLLAKMLEREHINLPDLITDFGKDIYGFDQAFYQETDISVVSETCNSLAALFEAISMRFDPLIAELRKRCDDTDADFQLLSNRQDGLASSVNDVVTANGELESLVRDLHKEMLDLRKQNADQETELDELRKRLMSMLE